MTLTPRQVRRFQRKVNATRRVFHYQTDRKQYEERDFWAFPPLKLVKINGLWRLRRVGDCEDGALDAGRRFYGGKEKFLEALDRGDCTIWHCTTEGFGGKGNHAALEIGGHFVETIFWTVTDKPSWHDKKHLQGPIYMKKPRSAQYVRAKLGMGAGNEHDLSGGP